MREYLDPVIETDQCAKYVEDIGIAAKSPEQLITSFQAMSQCNQNIELKLPMAKCHFVKNEVEFLGRTITTIQLSVNPQKKITIFPVKVKFPRFKEKH